MAFFQYGGRRMLRPKVEGKRKVSALAAVPSLKISPPSPNDEKDPTDLKWITHAFANPTYQDGGEGVHPDGGLVDDLIKGAETPRGKSPRLKEL